MRQAPVLGMLAVVTMLPACTTQVVSREITAAPLESEVSPPRSTAATLGVPPGHLPPPGRCRVWIPGTPPGKQPKVTTCSGIEASAPAGSMILYRPTADRKRVEARYVDRARAGLVVRVVVFDVETGRVIGK
jgi:hypothetical protein